MKGINFNADLTALIYTMCRLTALKVGLHILLIDGVSDRPGACLLRTRPYFLDYAYAKHRFYVIPFIKEC